MRNTPMLPSARRNVKAKIMYEHDACCWVCGVKLYMEPYQLVQYKETTISLSVCGDACEVVARLKMMQVSA